MKQRPLLVRALGRTILCFAVFHLTYLAIAAIVKKDWTTISLFSILDFDMFSSKLATSVGGFVVGLLVIAAVYGICYVWTKHDSASS